MKRKYEELRMLVFLLVLSTMCAALLAGGNSMYQRVLQAVEIERRKEILAGFGVQFNDDSFPTVFTELVDLTENEKSTYYVFRGDPPQVAIVTEGSGLWSVIELLFAIDLNTMTVTNLEVLAHGETPGLGGRIAEPWFMEQFDGVDVSSGIAVVKQRTGASGEVDAITGATATSNAVMSIINTALASMPAGRAQ